MRAYVCCLPVVVGAVELQNGQFHMVHAARDVRGTRIDLLIGDSTTHSHHGQRAALTAIRHLQHSSSRPCIVHHCRLQDLQCCACMPGAQCQWLHMYVIKLTMLASSGRVLFTRRLATMAASPVTQEMNMAPVPALKQTTSSRQHCGACLGLTCTSDPSMTTGRPQHLTYLPALCGFGQGPLN